MTNEIVEPSYNIETWEELDIDTDILRGIYAFGFEKPSPIQRQSIKPIIKRRDVIAQAQSGTGKTGCFTIGTLAVIDLNKKTVQAVLLSPTRELAIQTKSVLDSIALFAKNFHSQLVVGGIPCDILNEELKNNIPQVIVGCHGRVYHMFKRK